MERDDENWNWKQRNWLCPSCLEAILDNPTDKCRDCGGHGVDVREAQ